MILLLTVLIAIVSLALIMIILVQNPKGGGLNSAFGGSTQAANNFLGAANATNALETTTWGLATALLVLCLATATVFKPATNNVNPLNPDLDKVAIPK